ncbi:MAG: hypothetical protein LBP64_02495 [Tannerella sp.]|jgi:hypothetical protein|nr:hypothetical protein [Tannerella sp.]
MYRTGNKITAGLHDYMCGNRKGKQVNRLEREAMRDAFLAEAMDGYDSVAGDHARRVAALRRQLSAKTRRRGRAAGYAGIAAAALLCIAVGSYFILHREPENLTAQYMEHRTVADEASAESTPPATAEPEPPAQEALPETVAAAAVRRTPQARPTPAAAQPVAQPEEAVEAAADTTLTAVVLEPETQAAPVAEAQPEPDTTATPRPTRPALRTMEHARLDGFTDSRADRPRADEQDPQPAIGEEEYAKYLKESLIRPATGRCADVKGIVRVEFRIDKAGKPHSFRIKKKLCDEADREAVRLIEQGSTWVGGKKKKITVDVEF